MSDVLAVFNTLLQSKFVKENNYILTASINYLESTWAGRERNAPLMKPSNKQVERTPPFHFCGADFARPFYCRSDLGQEEKSYIMLFTCAVPRACHLELTKNLSTYEVLRALQKFLARRPTAQHFVSDNGASFRRTDKEIRLVYKHIADGDLAGWPRNSRVTWTFKTPAAPWVGGFWERMVGATKRCLHRVIGKSKSYFRDLEVILCGVESMINQRPLTPKSTNPSDIKALSLLFGYEGTTFFPEMSDRSKNKADIGAVVFSKRWNFQQSVLTDFWRRFQTEYLAFLRSAHSRKPVNRRSLQTGEICILKEEKTSRDYWPLVRILEMRGGKEPDSRKRSCTILTGRGLTLVRQIQLLYPPDIENPDPLY
ncbi:uncharacterized protein LOC108864469 [Galendromus occidentalis]|uniref:Uncharacterized protein LOC108864469 n=1 Tax=Galendromus occidentalis TaxID=34638 RepID=A0AAJ7PA01_9ACAR|nr:uncharacterized protein LOC108864469 [Galendromus occidentalis]